MLDNIILFSIRNKLIIGLLMIALIAWGGYSVVKLPIDAVPDITTNQAQIITINSAFASEEMERLVTFPVEQATATIPGITEIRSFSRFGLSLVTIVFEDDIDIYWGRQQIAERIQQVRSQLPAGISPDLAPVSTGLGEVYQYVVHTEKGYEGKYSLTDLRTMQDWIIRRQLLGVKGVADVNTLGGLLKQYEVAIDPDKLRSMNTSLDEIFTALAHNNQNTGGAYIDKTPEAFFIKSEGLIKTVDDIGRIVIKNTAQHIPVLIRDVATVRIGAATRYGAVTFKDEGEAVGAIVMMLKGANSSEVISNIKTRISEIQKTLPEGIVIEPFLDRTKMVNNAIGTVTNNLIEGALIVIFVLVIFLGNLRAGLIVASVIPLSMLFAVSMMNFFGVSGNLMSLGAIDFGLIVDGAVIIVEATMHHLGSRVVGRISQQDMDKEVNASASSMMNSAAFGQVIILIVYMPILALSGIEGKMFKPMAQTVSFAILGAFLLSLTYVPMISSLLLNKTITHKETISDKLMRFFQRYYTPVIQSALRQRAITVIIAFSLFIISLFVFINMGGEFLPTLEEGDFAIETRVLTGSSLTQTVDAVTKASAILLDKFPEVEKTVSKLGSGEIPTEPNPMDMGDIIVSLKPKSEWTSADSREELATKMATALEDIPGASFGFQQPVQMRFNELISGAKQDIAVKIFGEDLNVLTQLSQKIGQVINTVEGAQDLYIEQMEGLPQIIVTYNRQQIAQFGLTIEDINRSIRTAFAGEVTGMVYEGERRFDLVVRLDKQRRKNVEDVRNLYITTPTGEQVPLSQVATVDIKSGPNQIQREDAKRRLTVGFNVRGRDIESTVEELRQKIDARVDMPVGYYATYGGQFENLAMAKQRLSIAVPVALLLIFVLLFFAFQSVKQSLLIFSAIPLSAIGGVFGLLIRGMPFSISAGVGFIALFGVAVLNGIVLIAEFNKLKAQGMNDLNEIIFTGTRTRLRPILMTATVASLGFLPMALSNGSGAEVQKPLATVVIGGLVTSTLLTLIVLPCLYVYAEKFTKIKKDHHE